MEGFGQRGRNEYRTLVGQPGVVYVLKNDGLRHGWFKIGCSTRSGQARAMDLNTDANTGTPGVFRCIYQVRTMDCGTAEQEVFSKLSAHRRGKWGQEFFEVDLALAKETIRLVCSEVDQRRVTEPSPALTTAAGDDTDRPPSGGILNLARPVGGAVVGRSRWRRSSRPSRRRWIMGTVIIGVVVVLAVIQGEQKSQRAASSPAPQASTSTLKAAKLAGGARPGPPSPASRETTGPDGSPQVAKFPAAQASHGASDLSVLASPSSGAQAHAASSSGAAEPAPNAGYGQVSGPSRSERSSSMTSCSSERMMQDPAAYSRCVSGQPP